LNIWLCNLCTRGSEVYFTNSKQMIQSIYRFWRTVLTEKVVGNTNPLGELNYNSCRYKLGKSFFIFHCMRPSTTPANNPAGVIISIPNKGAKLFDGNKMIGAHKPTSHLITPPNMPKPAIYPPALFDMLPVFNQHTILHRKAMDNDIHCA
jgi:hypothetical protein